jgi:hypothetical protein
MVHTHYSPFQFSNDLRASEDTVLPPKKMAAKLKKMVKVLPKAALMSREEGHTIISLKSPTAFISPNSVDAMRTIKSVFGC